MILLKLIPLGAQDRIDIGVLVRKTDRRKLRVLAKKHFLLARFESVLQNAKSARSAQRERFKGAAIYCNAQMGVRGVREHCRHDEGGARLLEGAMRALGLSARGYARFLKVARTIADLAGEPKIGVTRGFSRLHDQCALGVLGNGWQPSP